MKSNLLRKAKWYVLGLILAIIMLTVSLSFCSWDNLSCKAKITANSGKFMNVFYNFTDKNDNGRLDNGDIITDFGKYDLVVIETYDNYYMVITHSIIDVRSAYSVAKNTDYMTSDIRTKLNTVDIKTYTSEQQGKILSRSDIGGDKLWLLSLDEAQTGFFQLQNNRLEKDGYWWRLRTPSKYQIANDRVGTVESDGKFNISPQDDLPEYTAWYRYGMYLKK